MLPPSAELVDRADEAFCEARDASARLEVMQVDLVLDVDRVEEDEFVVVGDVEGGEERRGVVRDEVGKALRRGQRGRRRGRRD